MEGQLSHLKNNWSQLNQEVKQVQFQNFLNSLSLKPKNDPDFPPQITLISCSTQADSESLWDISPRSFDSPRQNCPICPNTTVENGINRYNVDANMDIDIDMINEQMDKKLSFNQRMRTHSEDKFSILGFLNRKIRERVNSQEIRLNLHF